MYPNLKEDIYKLLSDTKKTKQGLNTLKQDCALWARDYERNDLTDLLNNLKRLEYDVVKFESDWNLMTSPRPGKKHNSQVFHSFHLVFVNLDMLFNDLKKIRNEMTENYIHSNSLRQLEIDWRRFFKTIEQIQEYISN